MFEKWKHNEAVKQVCAVSMNLPNIYPQLRYAAEIALVSIAK